MVAEKASRDGPEDSGGAARPRRKSARQLVATLRRRLRAKDADWVGALFEAIADWPLAAETVFDREFVYLIDGEAFDWVALTDRLLMDPGLSFPPDAKERLIGAPGFPEGMTEAEFRRRMGHDKQRAYMNYFYGVTVEQALLLAVENDILKRRYSNGLSPNDSRWDDAYIHLYGAYPEALLREFRHARPEVPGNRRARLIRTTTMQQAAAFTYWLFKRRLEKADPARLASDTRKGLEQLSAIRTAQARRVRSAARSSR